jgi:predicted ATPase
MQVSGYGIVCDRSIYLATQARLGYEELQPMLVKGVADPVEMYRPTGEKIRLERKQVPLIGRTTEQIEIGQILQSTKHGPSKVFILEGEAGIGKSRLVEKIMADAANLGINQYWTKAESGSDKLQFHAWRDIFWQVFNLDKLNNNQERIDRLTAALNGSGSDSQNKTELEIIHSLLVSSDGLEISSDGGHNTNHISDVCSKLLQAGINNSPAVIILENAQDLDQNSWDFLQSGILKVNNLLVVIATRPLSEPLPSGYIQLMRAPNSAEISLKGLSPEESYLLACEHLGVVSLPIDLVEIIDRAAGNPQFVEEMVYILRDDGHIQVVDGECQVLPHVDLGSIIFPTTAEGLIKSRLDRLSPSEQLTLKIASVIGEEFSLELLAELYPLDSDRPFIVKHLETFANLDLVLPGPKNNSYAFRDDITYQAVYSSMLFSQRRQLHRQLAEWFEENKGDELPVHYAVLANHWRKADDTAKAIDFLEKAGQRALEQGDYEKAEYYFRECLELDSTSAVLSTEFFKKKLQGEFIQN